MEIVLLDGFEGWDTTDPLVKWDTISNYNSITLGFQYGRNGSGARVQTGGTSVFDALDTTTALGNSSAMLEKLFRHITAISSIMSVDVGMAIKLVDKEPVDYIPIFSFLDTSQSSLLGFLGEYYDSHVQLLLTPQQQLAFCSGNFFDTPFQIIDNQYSPPLKRGVFSYIEASLFHGISGSLKLKIDGKVVINVQANTVSNPGKLQVGGVRLFHHKSRIGAGGNARTFYIDDVYITLDGPGQFQDNIIEVSVPLNNGEKREWVPSNGLTFNYDMVNELSPDEDVTYNEALLAGRTDTYDFPASSNTGAVLGVTLNVSAANKVKDRATMSGVVRQSGVDYHSLPQAIGTIDYRYNIYGFKTNPATGSPFSVAELANNEFGMSLVTVEGDGGGGTPPSAPSNLNATTVSDSEISLTWTDNSNNEVSFLIERSLNEFFSFTQIAAVGANSTSYTNSTGLSASTTYYYRIRAANSSGTSGYSNTDGATTNAESGTPPTAPSGLTATAVANSQTINLAWTDNANNETSFKIERSLEASANFVQIATVSANVTTYSNSSGLSASTLYYYRVRAANAAGNSSYSNTASATTGTNTPGYLTDPLITDNKAYIVTPAETGSYILQGPVGELGQARWAFLTDGIGVTHQISSSTNNLGSSSDGSWQTTNDILSGKIVASLVNGRTSYELTLNTLQSQYYACGEVDLLLLAVGPLPDVTVNEPGIIPFAQQQPLSLLSSLTLTWTQSVVAALQGGRCGGGLDVAITMISVYFKNIVNNQTLQYQIYTYDTRGYHPNGTWFATAGSFFGVADNIVHYGGVYLTVGGPSASFMADIITRVKALMLVCPNPALDANPANWKIILLSAGPFTNGAASITSTIRDVNMTVSGSSSNAGSFPPAAPSGLTATAVSSSQINLAWTDNSSDESGFNIERSLYGASSFTQIATVGANVTSYSNSTGLSPSTAYDYRVRAYSAAGNSSYSNTANATTNAAAASAPAAPTNLGATATSNSQINLAWTDNANNETSFKIERSPSGAGSFVQIDTVNTNVITYENTGLSASTTYDYRVRASNATGDSSYSNTASATTSSGSGGASADFYVSLLGSDGNTGTIDQPFRTIGKGISVLTAGKKVFVRSGTYTERIDNQSQTIPSGTSHNAAVIVSAYPGETVTVRPASGNAVLKLTYSGTVFQYITFENIVFDANRVNQFVADFDGVNFSTNIHHLRFSGCEFKNALQSGVIAKRGANFLEFINCKVYDNGVSLTQDHGLYLQSSDCLVSGGSFYGNTSAGIQIYTGFGGDSCNRNIVRKARIYSNRYGLVMGSGDNNFTYNTLLYSNTLDGVEIGFTCTNAKFLNNTAYSNGGDGIQIQASSTAALIKNNIAYLNGTNINNLGTGTVQTTNLTTNPTFVDASNANFRLQTSSAALDVGTTLSDVPDDFEDNIRPQGVAYDIGACERIA